MSDDFNDDMPGIRATEKDRVGAASVEHPAAAQEPPVVRAVREPVRQRQRNGALWAVCCSLLVALLGLGYWVYQQHNQLQRQLVATQESFARISEEAAGRLQDISGKVSANESSLSEGEQARIQQLNQLTQSVERLTATQQTQQDALQAQQQKDAAQTERLAGLDKLTSRLNELLEQQQQGFVELEQQLDSSSQAQSALRNEMLQIGERQQALTVLEQQLAEQDSQLARMRGELQALLEVSSGPNVEQEMLVLRSELDLQLASVEDALQAIDSFRLQTNRTLSTLQNQISNLQQQLSQH